MIMNSGNSMMENFLKSFFSSIPEDEFEARLKDLGIEDKNIQKLKDMIGYHEGGDEK